MRNFALITGAASGIGREMARQLFATGEWNLALLDRDEAGLRSLEEELRPGPGTVLLSRCDVSSADEVAAAFADLAPALDRTGLQLVANCAGRTHVGLFAEMRMEDFESLIGVNLLGTARIARAALPLLRPLPNGDLPVLVNLASLAGLVGAPGLAAYSASKFGVVGFSEALRQELRARARVCVACPGFVRTAILENATGVATGVSGEKMRSFLARFGSSPERAARKILRAALAGRSTVLVNPEAHLFHHLNRVAPSLCGGIVTGIFSRLGARP